MNGAYANGVQILRTSAGEESNFQVIAALPAGQASYTDNTVTYGAGVLHYRVQSLPLFPHNAFLSPKYASVSVSIGGEVPHHYVSGWTFSDGSGNANQAPEYIVTDGSHGIGVPV